MTTIRMSKARIIKAIRTEPVRTLQPGAWMALTDDATDRGLDKIGVAVASRDCAVCAVGAVLRASLLDTESIHDAGDAVSPALASRVARRRLPPAARLDYDRLRARDLRGDAIGFWGEATSAALRTLLHTRAPLRALSNYFEHAASLYKTITSQRTHRYALTPAQTRALRARTVAFVVRYFPRSLDIHINGCRPARGLDVLAYGRKARR